MANFSKLKKSNLGDPPPKSEASTNLTAPETAPADVPALLPESPITDGRSLHKTNRTMPFATRVTPEWLARLRAIAERDELKMVEVLERALDAYEANQ